MRFEKSAYVSEKDTDVAYNTVICKYSKLKEMLNITERLVKRNIYSHPSSETSVHYSADPDIYIKQLEAQVPWLKQKQRAGGSITWLLCHCLFLCNPHLQRPCEQSTPGLPRRSLNSTHKEGTIRPTESISAIACPCLFSLSPGHLCTHYVNTVCGQSGSSYLIFFFIFLFYFNLVSFSLL